MLKINGVAIATPSIFTVDISDIDGEGSNRNALGQMTRDRIATKIKLTCEWGPLNDSQISTLLKSVRNIFFTVEYPDPYEGSKNTKTFYVGDRSAPMYNCAGGKNLWSGIKMNFVEQ